ncbi:hypothetical protein ACOAOT_24195 [Lacrimispora sp. AGF001]|uniref:hypothetical protein n=1 Tax=Lacrimispora sp. AGF001 TaxID=3401631 RepID=UPI003B4318AF
MKNNDTIPCKHQYIVGYSFRMPQPFFRNLPCDKCGCRIELSLSWKLLYILIEFFSVFLAYKAAELADIRILGSTFLPWLVIFVFISLIIGQLNRLILKYGKWVDAE